MIVRENQDVSIAAGRKIDKTIMPQTIAFTQHLTTSSVCEIPLKSCIQPCKPLVHHYSSHERFSDDVQGQIRFSIARFAEEGLVRLCCAYACDCIGSISAANWLASYRCAGAIRG